MTLTPIQSNHTYQSSTDDGNFFHFVCSVLLLRLMIVFHVGKLGIEFGLLNDVFCFLKEMECFSENFFLDFRKRMSKFMMMASVELWTAEKNCKTFP